MLEEYLKFRLLQKLWHKESKQINIKYNTEIAKILPKNSSEANGEHKDFKKVDIKHRKTSESI